MKKEAASAEHGRWAIEEKDEVGNMNDEGKRRLWRGDRRFEEPASGKRLEGRSSKLKGRIIDLLGYRLSSLTSQSAGPWSREFFVKVVKAVETVYEPLHPGGDVGVVGRTDQDQPSGLDDWSV